MAPSGGVGGPGSISGTLMLGVTSVIITLNMVVVSVGFFPKAGSISVRAFEISTSTTKCIARGSAAGLHRR